MRDAGRLLHCLPALLPQEANSPGKLLRKHASIWQRFLASTPLSSMRWCSMRQATQDDKHLGRGIQEPLVEWRLWQTAA